MPNDNPNSLKDLIDGLEKNTALTRRQIKEFGLSDEKIRSWSIGPSKRLILTERNLYQVGPGLEKLYKVQTRYGTWRPDLQEFHSKTYVPEEVWQADLKERILRNSRSDGLLPEVNFNKNSYTLDFLPARYSRIIDGAKEYHHFVFDYLRDLTPKHLALNARLAEGQGKWELAQYYRQLSVPKESHDVVLANVIQRVQSHSGQLGDSWRVWALSEKHSAINRPSLPIELFQERKGKKAALFDPLSEGTHFNAKTKTLFFGSNHFEKNLAEADYRGMFAKSMRESGQKLSSMVSVTFRRILPAVAVGVSIDEVAKASDKVDATLHETTKHSGAFTGAGLGALGGSWLGPLGALAGGLIGGYAGWEGSDAAYKANKNYWNKPNAESTTSTNTQQTFTSASDLAALLNPWLHKKSDDYCQPTSSFSDLIKKLRLSDAVPETSTATCASEIDVDDISPPVANLFQPGKTFSQIKTEYDEVSRLDDDQLTESDHIVLDYFKDSFSYVYHKQKFNLKSKQQTDLESLFLLDNAGKAGAVLGKIAFDLKNPELGTALTVMGGLAQGMSSAILFMQSSGALALGHFVGVLSALSSIISVFSQDDDTMQHIFEAFKEIFKLLEEVRKELHALRQELAQFRKDLFEYLHAYFSALLSRLFYQEEIVRNGFNQMRYEFFVSRELLAAILAQLDDEVIYKARDYFDKVRDIFSISRTELENLLTALWLRLDKSSASYKSGELICRAQDQFGSMTALEDIQAMLEVSAKRGQLPGYLACYYQVHNLVQYLHMENYPTHMINPLIWSELVHLYLYARRTPNARHYDLQLERLHYIEQQGLDYWNFIRAHRSHLPEILKPLLQDIYTLLNDIIKSFDYPDNAQQLLKTDHEVPEDIKAVMNKFPAAPLDKGYSSRAVITNEFLALVKSGAGKFAVRNEGCPIHMSLDENLYPHKHGGGAIGRMNGYLEDMLDGGDSSHLHYVNSVLYVQEGREPSRLVLTDFSLYGRALFQITGCRIKGSNYKNYTEEGQQLSLQQRRKFSEAQAAALEKNLPVYREKLTRLFLHIKAILTATGILQQVADAFPVLTFPEELTPWVNIYRADTHHTELYRAWPKPTEAIDVFQKVITSVQTFENFIVNLATNFPEEMIYNSPELKVALQALLDIQKFQTEFLESNRTYTPEAHDSSSASFSNENTVKTEQPSQKTNFATDYVEILKMFNSLMEQNKKLQEQNDQLVNRLDKLESKATIYVEADIQYDIKTVLDTWASKTLLSDERKYTHPENDQHYFIVRRLTQNWQNISAHDLHCDWRDDVLACANEDLEYIEYRPAEIPPSIAQMLGNAAARGAISSALPEAVGDWLFLHDVVSEQEAVSIKWIVYIGVLLYLNGPACLLSLILAEGLFRACCHLGLSESNTRLATSAASFFINTAPQLTSAMGVATTVTHILAGRAALFAEKKVMESLVKNKKSANIF